ncbi:MAG: hypothetical protein HC781_19680 [Leptolyngbyaceae cyanobacterium CSU_1_4]|nr:hypothetical protein [Leptolyngbyaceae cyanobacterium CSU_1_4]
MDTSPRTLLTFISRIRNCCTLIPFRESVTQYPCPGIKRKPALITPLATASGMALWGASSAFWRLVAIGA